MEKIGRNTKISSLKNVVAAPAQTRGSSKTTVAKPNFMYIPLYVLNNLVRQASKKSVNLTPQKGNDTKGESKSKLGSTTTGSKSEPAVYITEKNGKRYLVVNPQSSLVKGFAKVDSNYVSFGIPENFGQQDYPFSNGMSSFMNAHPGPFGNGPIFQQSYLGQGPSFNGYPFLNGHINGAGMVQGFIAVPVMTRIGANGLNGFGENYGQGMGTPYYPPNRVSQDGYASDETFNSPGPMYRPANFGSFMYGPAYFGNPFFHRNAFERMSTNQPIVPGHFYRDPEYDPTESESMFQDNRYSNQDHAPEQELNENENNEISNEMQWSGNRIPMTVGEGGATEGVNAELAEEGAAPEPVRISEPGKRSEAKPIVFTKDHVGFGPITVEAKTANAPMDDPEIEDH